MITKIAVLSLLAIVAFSAFEFAWIKFGGKPVPVPAIPRGSQTTGQGPALTFVVLGDSTTISQGGDYAQGYATRAAEYLSQTHTVTWTNLGISGARAEDVVRDQLPRAVALKPDVVLVGVGANDVTHLTPAASVGQSLESIVNRLRQANPAVRIVLTGSPAMGVVPRLPQPLRWLAGWRTSVINRHAVGLARDHDLVFAPVAEKTGPVFRTHHELFAADNFHPTTQGYEVWTPVILDALSRLPKDR